jgi:hypothetical protein
MPTATETLRQHILMARQLATGLWSLNDPLHYLSLDSPGKGINVWSKSWSLCDLKRSR